MEKVKRLGIAKPDDPIYKEGWSVSTPAKKVAKKKKKRPTKPV